MARIDTLTNFLTDVSDAIRQKTGGSNPIPASQFDTEILSIETVGNYQDKSITITENGTFNLLPDTGYDAISNVRMTVDVEGSTPMEPTTATQDDVISPKTFYSNGQKLIGTIPNNGTLSYTPSSTNQLIPEGYTSGGLILGDANLIASNIKDGVTIFGITGTYGGEGGQWVDYDESFVLTGCNQTMQIADPASVYKNRTTDTVDGSNGWNYRTYLRFDLLDLEAFPENYRITGATLNFYLHSGNDYWRQSTYICTTPTQMYNPDTLCWNNQPGYTEAPLSRQFNMTRESIDTWISLNIKDIVLSWQQGVLNCGLLLKGGENGYRYNWSLRTMYSDASYKPYIRLTGKKFIRNSDISL